MATEIKGSNLVKVMKPNYDGSSKGKSVLPINNNIKKKIESSSSKHVVLDSKNNSVSTFTKSVVKEKGSAGSSKTTTTTTAVKVKQKKVYTLAGQKYDRPEEREPLRIFYESLSKQIPSSEMAEFWMMEHGLLSPERSKRAFERKQRRQQQLRMGTPIKSASKPYNKPESSQSQKPQVSKSIDMKVKKRMEDDDDYLAKRKKLKM